MEFFNGIKLSFIRPINWREFNTPEVWNSSFTTCGLYLCVLSKRRFIVNFLLTNMFVHVVFADVVFQLALWCYAQLMNIRTVRWKMWATSEGIETKHRYRQIHTHTKKAYRKSSKFRLDHCKQTLCFQALTVMQELYFEGCHVTFG